MLAITSVLAVVLVACGDAAVDETTNTTAVTTTTSSSSTTTTTEATTTTSGMTTSTDEPVDPVGEAQTAPLVTEGFPGTGETAFLADVRLGRYEAFERLVLEFDEAVPEYRIEYVEAPIVESPSGNVIEVDGDAYLSLTMSPATGVDLSGDEPEETYEGPDRLTSADSLAIAEVVKKEDFENVMSWVIGLDETLSFGATILEDPHRLVIDIRND
jgi:hypothetical protein